MHVSSVRCMQRPSRLRRGVERPCDNVTRSYDASPGRAGRQTPSRKRVSRLSTTWKGNGRDGKEWWGRMDVCV